MTFAVPRAIESIARVAMNGGSFATVTPRPLASPQRPPTRTAAMMLSHSGQPALCDVQPRIIIDKANTAATDRSIPAVMMTNVIPSARITRMVTWSRMLSRLLAVRKNGVAMKRATQRTRRPTSGPPVPLPSFLTHAGTREPGSAPVVAVAGAWVVLTGSSCRVMLSQSDSLGSFISAANEWDLVHEHPTVDVDRLPGDVSPRVRGEEEEGFGDVVTRAR